jgi:ADP-ribosylglycohydrolase
MNKRQEDIIKGVFFGQAIGDALGLGTEFLTRNQILDIYPHGLTEYRQITQDEHRSRWAVGDWTDDTAQFLCIVDAILEHGEINEQLFAKQVHKWFKDAPMGIGQTVLKVVSVPQYTLYPHKAAELVWKLSKYRSAANGAIMRTSALGLWEYSELEKVIVNTENICKATHFDPRCVGSCVIITSIIATLMQNGSLLTENELVEIAEKYDHRISDYIRLAKRGCLEQLELDERSSMGYTLKTLSAGLWAYFNAKDFEDGLIKIVNQGGDADTNAAVACSLLGAKFGLEGIPEKYIDGLLRKDLLIEKVNFFIDKDGVSTSPNAQCCPSDSR